MNNHEDYSFKTIDAAFKRITKKLNIVLMLVIVNAILRILLPHIFLW
jgi:hypothetical protein